MLYGDGMEKRARGGIAEDRGIIKETVADVTSLLKSRNTERLQYHNLGHALEVASVARKLGLKESLDLQTLDDLTLAGLYHDVGFSERYKNNESFGAATARSFLERRGRPEERIRRVEALILSTRMPPEPKNLLEEIMCAADHGNASKPSFFPRGESLRKEIEAEEGCEMSQLDWYTKQRDYLQGLLNNAAFMQAARRFGMESGMRLNMRKLNTLIEDIALDNLPRYIPQTDAVFGKLSAERRP